MKTVGAGGPGRGANGSAAKRGVVVDVDGSAVSNVVVGYERVGVAWVLCDAGRVGSQMRLTAGIGAPPSGLEEGGSPAIESERLEVAILMIDIDSICYSLLRDKEG